MKIKNSQKKEGFTIMETLIAISLLLLAITGPMVFAQNALRAAFNSRDQITAYYLAQDAIEFVKNIRDNNILSGNAWLYGLDECDSLSGCTVDTSDGLGKIESCSAMMPGCVGSNVSQDLHLKIDEESIIGHEGNDESIFSRTIKIDNQGDEAKITIYVRWKSHENIGTRDITVVEYIYNWADAILNPTDENI